MSRFSSASGFIQPHCQPAATLDVSSDARHPQYYHRLPHCWQAPITLNRRWLGHAHRREPAGTDWHHQRGFDRRDKPPRMTLYFRPPGTRAPPVSHIDQTRRASGIFVPDRRPPPAARATRVKAVQFWTSCPWELLRAKRSQRQKRIACGIRPSQPRSKPLSRAAESQ